MFLQARYISSHHDGEVYFKFWSGSPDRRESVFLQANSVPVYPDSEVCFQFLIYRRVCTDKTARESLPCVRGGGTAKPWRRGCKNKDIQQSLSRFATAPFTQESLGSKRFFGQTKWLLINIKFLSISVGATAGLPYGFVQVKRQHFSLLLWRRWIAVRQDGWGARLLIRTKFDHLIHHYRGPPSPRGKAWLLLPQTHR